MLQAYKDDKIREQIEKDTQNALASLKVVPNKCIIKSFMKEPLKIQFKPVGMISTLNVQVCCQFHVIKNNNSKHSGVASYLAGYTSDHSRRIFAKPVVKYKE